VTGGRLTDPGTPGARLEVTFQPDPELWPADLLAAEGRTT
jgi:arsenite-transporting ATPase